VSLTCLLECVKNVLWFAGRSRSQKPPFRSLRTSGWVLTFDSPRKTTGALPSKDKFAETNSSDLSPLCLTFKLLLDARSWSESKN
jgi:hypothetical protein